MRVLFVVLAMLLSTTSYAESSDYNSPPTIDDYIRYLQHKQDHPNHAPDNGDECNDSHFDCFGDDYFCLNGKCVWEPGVEDCFTNFDCPFPERCVDGRCE